MAARLRLACDAVTDKMTQRTPARLARILLRLAMHWGEPTGEEIRFRVRTTNQELANMMGACRQTVNRTLSEFAACGLIRFEGRTLIVGKANALSDLVDEPQVPREFIHAARLSSGTRAPALAEGHRPDRLHARRARCDRGHKGHPATPPATAGRPRGA